MDEMGPTARATTAGCAKVFIQRDYQDGTRVKFQTKFPPELEDKIERSTFEHLVTTLNSYYCEAEKISGTTYFEGLLACFTAYLVYICMETHYEKCLKRVTRFIQEQNESIWIPRGLLVVDPIERGLRVVSFYKYNCKFS
uniref:Ras modification protein ERF4 n=1 Tax=Strigamia maritima TaxID=126957 RepID=T1JHD1_STRMM